jgi:hypothetical protein
MQVWEKEAAGCQKIHRESDRAQPGALLAKPARPIPLWIAVRIEENPRSRAEAAAIGRRRPSLPDGRRGLAPRDRVASIPCSGIRKRRYINFARSVSYKIIFPGSMKSRAAGGVAVFHPSLWPERSPVAWESQISRAFISRVINKSPPNSQNPAHPPCNMQLNEN